ncbi:F-box/kelch-repeat protein At1g57790-like [Telopea speciosissima]|uniref:F-box/kelch-repeat protein At1g57790-like n=1 Tax=Telopea speciosissima TaxID=54955 RepID=UPI001CC68C78|nr:F-box/kelch-repeat protein At1g57790-like [Telopea speciosissima]
MLYRVRVDELRPWSELPTEFQELIVSCLCLEDYVRWSCVCKEWRNVSRSLSAVNQFPWLLFSPVNDGKIKFFDPSQGNFYFDEIPDLKDAFIHCCKDGWVLLSQTNRIFFFNPFTKSRIDLPTCKTFPYNSVRFALSCAPTSPDSVLISIESHVGSVDISTFHPGDAQWTTVKYQNNDGGMDVLFNNERVDGFVLFFFWGHDPVFCNGLFYCFYESCDMVGIFDPQKHTWRVDFLHSINLPHLSYDQERTMHIVEFNGEIVLVCASYPRKSRNIFGIPSAQCSCHCGFRGASYRDKPIIFKLNWSEKKWVEMDSLNGVTVFVSSHYSSSEPYSSRLSRNSVYFQCLLLKVSWLWKV